MVPSLFLAHGSPMTAIEDNEYTEFLSQLGKRIQPKAIVIFTAHWESEILTISSSDEVYETIYDFYGFPEELYQVQYPAKGSSSIASKLQQKFEQYGIAIKQDFTRGLDHGSWTLLKHMYPDGEIPVIQLSVNPFLSPKEQFQIGEVLQGLGEDDILVIGSGVTVHNLRMIHWGQKTPEPWAVEFDDWLMEQIQNKNQEALFQYQKFAPHATTAVPRAEHFVPLFIAMGSGRKDTPEVIYRDYDLGTLSYLCMEF
ncbi:DODA-type extradiol aromatic ring-opening family dioxygenase [Risungbinella massiliensis]|uniref:DODA-type extradiol aromatic ring-opening family dioxygenase n=1 Tax=Risungbinella massiliensis TaxID=1329796 RepID=UPI0005CC48DC|nr:class III extradiol ring-cleavage dioxygenase [Risungbinella massiliensis]